MQVALREKQRNSVLDSILVDSELLNIGRIGRFCKIKLIKKIGTRNHKRDQHILQFAEVKAKRVLDEIWLNFSVSVVATQRIQPFCLAPANIVIIRHVLDKSPTLS